MTRFRPCIDLHEGVVKQIVGGSLRDSGPGPQTNYVAREDAAAFAARFRGDGLTGGHVIQLGPGNDAAARRALAAWPGGLQLGGGISDANAQAWLDAGAAQVIVTSWFFHGGELDWARVAALARLIGCERLVIDLSCRRVGGQWHVATDRWQTITATTLGREAFARLADHCAEFLIHAADVEGKRAGMDEALIECLAEWCPLPCTYAGGARELADLDRVARLSGGRLDLTIGSALDIYGGSIAYADCVAWNARLAG